MKKEMIEIAIKLESIKRIKGIITNYLEENAEMFSESDDYLFAIVNQGEPAVEVMRVLMQLEIEFEINYCKVDDGYIYYKGDKGYDD